MSGWWKGSRDEFLTESPDDLAGKLTTVKHQMVGKLNPNKQLNGENQSRSSDSGI